MTAQRIEEAASLILGYRNVTPARELAAQVLKPSLDHISKLEGERDRLREALEAIYDKVMHSSPREAARMRVFDVMTQRLMDKARAALNGSPPSDNKGKNDG